MRHIVRVAVAAAILLSPATSAWGADALSAFTNTGTTSPFGYGGYNAGPASFSPGSDCLGVAGFSCLKSSSIFDGDVLIGKVGQSTNIGATILDANYLNVLTYSSNGPSAAIFYNHDGSAVVKLRASFKLLANESPDSLVISIFREQTPFFLPEPVNLTGVTATTANAAGSFEAVVTEAGRYGVHVTRTSSLPFPTPAFDQRHDWVGINLEVLPNVAPVPEPGTWALMIGGFALAGTFVRRHNRAAAYT